MRTLSWRLILRAIAVLSWIVAIVWLIDKPGYEPLIAFLTGLAALLASVLVTPREYEPTDEQRLRNRRAMLDLVRSFWVKGVLEQSLHNAAMIELGMEEKPGAVEHPWHMVLQTDRQDRTLPSGTKIIDIFDEVGGGLLILGEPGSGKTTTLLELARDTIARAGEDPTHPIPVVFNLSSWADERQPIAEWLVDELNAKYNIPEKVARLWVECDELLLLLDGLDEVVLKCQEDCVETINEFRRDHLVPLVVCSRVADYEALTARLRLQGAVLLQPLTPQQIDEYLGGAGMALSAVRGTLKHDPTFRELADTPLMLSIMTLAYKGVPVADLQTLDTVEARRHHLLDTYVQRMFERREADELYPSRQTIHWLAWLAQKMSEHAQSVFLIEGLQPDWLAARRQRQLRIVATLFSGLVFGLGGGLVFGLAGGLGVMLGAGLVFGLGGGLVGVLGSRTVSIEPVEALKWSWREAAKSLPLWLVFWLVAVLVIGRGIGLVGVLGGGLVGGLVVALVSGLSGAEVEAKMVPNQGIRQSVRNALIAGLGAGLITVLVVGLILGLVFGLAGGLGVMLGAGLVVGLINGLLFSGEAVILHLALRYFLSRDGYLPWNLVRFLDYAAERIFLRKVGGGYIFVHRLLQDHFAALESQPAQVEKTTQCAPNLYRKWVPKVMLFIAVVIVAVTAYNADIHRKALAMTYLSLANRAALTPEKAYRYSIRATELDPSNVAHWNALCCFGSLTGHASDVLDVCEQIVDSHPDNGKFHDNRALARALTGDYDGAIKDFKFSIEWFKTQGTLIRRDISNRELWIAELEAGRNPFDEATLETFLYRDRE